MDRDVSRLSTELAFLIKQGARVIQTIFDIRRKSSAPEDNPHFVTDSFHAGDK
jgi:hypothetical protein